MVATTNNPNIPAVEEVQSVLYKVGANTQIYQGTAVCVQTTTSGYAFPAADTAGFKYIGQSMSEGNNTGGAAGDVSVQVIPPKDLFQFVAFRMTSPVQANVGALAYLTANDTVAVSSSNSIVAGRIIQIIQAGTSGVVLVDTMNRA